MVQEHDTPTHVSGCLPVLVSISLYTKESGGIIPTRTLSDSSFVIVLGQLLAVAWQCSV